MLDACDTKIFSIALSLLIMNIIQGGCGATVVSGNGMRIWISLFLTLAGND